MRHPRYIICAYLDGTWEARRRAGMDPVFRGTRDEVLDFLDLV